VKEEIKKAKEFCKEFGVENSGPIGAIWITEKNGKEFISFYSSQIQGNRIDLEVKDPKIYLLLGEIIQRSSEVFYFLTEDNIIEICKDLGMKTQNPSKLIKRIKDEFEYSDWYEKLTEIIKSIKHLITC